MINKLPTRLLILISTAVLTWGALTVFADTGESGPEVGDVASRDYFAKVGRQVEDLDATEAARMAAVERVEVVTRTDRTIEDRAFQGLETVIDRVEDATTLQPVNHPSVPPATTPAPDTTVDPNASTTIPPTTETEAPALSTLVGSVFVDVDGDGLFDAEPGEAWRNDFYLSGIELVAVAEDGTRYSGETDQTGSVVVEVPYGTYAVWVDADDPDLPAEFAETTAGFFRQERTCESEQCDLEPVGVAPSLLPLDERVAVAGAPIGQEASRALLTFVEQDLIRAMTGDPLAVEQIRAEAENRLVDIFRPGIETVTDALDAQADARTDPRSVMIDGRSNEAARLVVNELVSEFLEINVVEDPEETEAARKQARDLVEPTMESFAVNDRIISTGQTFDRLAVDAIALTGAGVTRSVRQLAVGAVVAILVAILGFYLARFRSRIWNRPRMVALFGLLIVLSALSVRLTTEFQDQSSWYVLPAVAFGYLSAVLFDNRMGTLMALAMGILAAVGTFEPGLAVYAVLATMAPIGFVSSVSSRHAFRNSVLISAGAAALIAAAAGSLFHVNPDLPAWGQIWPGAVWAGVVSLVASLAVLAALPFFESAFDITTTLRLLELTDRNHAALELLQEEAFGSFNHSLMVGTLADNASRAIGANNLLARAAAYYHDLGKTTNPEYYVENQFGSHNLHQDIPPEESAELIRQHVTDGMVLARRYGIPSEVADGILCHHGDGIMRFFYEKARQMYGPENVDPADYRHVGHKPQSREMAILMMADSVEGACRAVFRDEEPTPDSVAKVVTRVIDEKQADGQLSECDLTMGELTKVRQAFIEALVGHYHQRIPYPNFPGS